MDLCNFMSFRGVCLIEFMFLEKIMESKFWLSQEESDILVDACLEYHGFCAVALSSVMEVNLIFACSQQHSFYELIINKARGKSGPV